jgi:hypothetical protein
MLIDKALIHPGIFLERPGSGKPGTPAGCQLFGRNSRFPAGGTGGNSLYRTLAPSLTLPLPSGPVLPFRKHSIRKEFLAGTIGANTRLTLLIMRLIMLS